MESLLFRSRSGSFPFQTQIIPTSPRPSVSLCVQDNAVSVFSGDKNGVSSTMISLHMETSRRRIRRSFSDSDVTRLEMRTLSKLGSRSFTALPIPEEECDERVEDRRGYAGEWSASGISWEGMGFPGGGMNSNGKSSGGGSSGNESDADRNNIGAHYQEMLKSDPTNCLLLRNYGKYLHEVEGDLVKAEEYYGRAILASPGDGELLSLYGKLIWETQRDESRAKSYFTQAIHAAPHDCMVLGSYANFLWEAEEEQDGDEAQEDAAPVAAMVEAF